MNSFMKRKLIMLVAFFLSVCCLPQKNQAKEETSYFSDDYTYTIRIYAGGQGTFENGNTQITLQVKEGTELDFSQMIQKIVVNPETDAAGNENPSKYYAMGIRESGKDNRDKNVYIVQKVTRDMDYVVAYAIKGGDVAYTIRYLEKGTGKELLPARTFYGNVGEKPVIAYTHIAGYVPQAYSLTKTLQSDEAGNVFDFYYQPGNETVYQVLEKDGGTIYTEESGDTVITYEPEEENTIPEDTGVKVIVATQQQNQHQMQTHTTDTPPAVASEDIAKEDTEKEDIEPKTIIDLDEPQVPLSDGNDLLPSAEKKREELPLAGIVIAGALSMAIIVRLYFLLLKKKRNSKKEKQDEEKIA